VYLRAAGTYSQVANIVGPQGIQGNQGLQGLQGLQGIQGTPGTNGSNGSQGIQGIPGTAGTNGTNGTNGADGRTILSGIIAPIAGQGSDGDYFINTLTSTLYGPKAAGAWPGGVSIVGPAGAQGNAGSQGLQGLQGIQGNAGTAGSAGAPGAVWRAGAGVPSNAMGIDGDWYIDTATSNVYTRSSGTYTTGLNIKGAQGTAGTNGTNGTNGLISAAIPYRTGTGRYIGGAQDAAALSTLGGAANRIDLIPFLCPYDMTITGLATNCTTLIAAAQGKVGIYSSDANGRPTTLMEEITTVQDYGTVGAKVSTFASSKALVRGNLYWLMIRHSSTATLSGYATSSSFSLGFGTAIATSQLTLLRRTLAFATAAPNPWTWVATEETSSVTTAIALLGAGA
jgi:hypothetical protein